MKLGAAFRFVDSRIDDHLWVIVTPPALDPFVLLSFTTFREGRSDASCVLEAGEQASLTVRSCVSYEKPLVLSPAEFRRFEVAWHDPFPPALLRRIWHGAAVSPFVTLTAISVLSEHGYISMGRAE